MVPTYLLSFLETSAKLLNLLARLFGSLRGIGIDRLGCTRVMKLLPFLNLFAELLLRQEGFDQLRLLSISFAHNQTTVLS